MLQWWPKHMKVKNTVNFNDTMSRLISSEVSALNSNSDEIKSRLENNTPRDPRGKYPNSSLSLRESVVIQEATPKKRYIKVGYDKQHEHVGRFVNDGTIYQDPQNQVDKTNQEIKSDIIPKIKNNIRL